MKTPARWVLVTTKLAPVINLWDSTSTWQLRQASLARISDAALVGPPLLKGVQPDGAHRHGGPPLFSRGVCLSGIRRLSCV